jgi:hypothetical protein
VKQSLTTAGRPRSAAVGAVLISLIAVAASPVVAGAQPAPHQQSAVSPSFAAPFFFGSFNAVSDAGGANPSGEVNYHLGRGSGSNTSATVVCLAVSGNTAVIGFQGTINRPLVPPEPVVGELVVADNAPGPTLLDTVGLSQRITDTGTANCSTPGPLTIGPLQVSGDVIVHPPRGRMVGKGSVSGTGGTAAYSYILRCDAAQNVNAPFEVRFGTQRFRLTSATSVTCSDDPAVTTPAAGFDTMTGSGFGLLTPAGGVARVDWKFVDGGAGGLNDRVELTIRRPLTVIDFAGTAAPPGKFPGSDQATGNNTAQTR